MSDEKMEYKTKIAESNLRPSQPQHHWMEGAESIVQGLMQLEPEEQNQMVKYIYESVKNLRIEHLKEASTHAKRLDDCLGEYCSMIQ